MRVGRPHRIAAVLVATGLLATFGVALSAEASSPPSLRAEVFQDARAGLVDLMVQTSLSDPGYFAAGRFHMPGTRCDRCELGPAVAAAALYRRTGDTAMRFYAVKAMDDAISRQKPDGSWGPANPPYGNDVESTFFAEHLGMLTYSFGSTLDPGRQAGYRAALARAVGFLVARKAHTYASNGNINLAITVAYGMAWRLTGENRFGNAYQDALALTLAPGPVFPGYGFRATKVGAKTLGRDSAGFLAEHGSGGVGYDPYYTQFQADLAVQGFVVVRDVRLLQLGNELTNQMMSRVSTRDWRIDVSGGTRITTKNRTDPFTTPALLVSGMNGRPELNAAAGAQTRAASAYFRQTAPSAWNGIYQSWGTQFATTILTVK